MEEGEQKIRGRRSRGERKHAKNQFAGVGIEKKGPFSVI